MNLINSLVKTSIILKPYNKLTYLLALLVLGYLGYLLFFEENANQSNAKESMFSLLILAWLALINLMFQVFTRVPEKKLEKQPFFSRVKNQLHRGVYYILTLIFIGLSMALIILSFKMLNL